MPPAWSCIVDDEEPSHDAKCGVNCDSGVTTIIDSSKSLDAVATLDDDDDTNSQDPQRDTRSKSVHLPMRAAMRQLLKRPRVKQPTVPSISLISLFNRLQTSSVVVIDCRSAADFNAGHIRGALHCEHGRRNRHKTVDDVLRGHSHSPLAYKLANREMMEVVVIGSNRTASSLLNRMDGGFRLAKMLLKEGLVFSVAFLTVGFHAFALKYPFMLTSSSSSSPSSSTSSSTCSDSSLEKNSPVVPSPLQYPNEIVSDFLYLGNFWQANNAQIIHDLGITHVINMGAITDDRNTFDHVSYLDVEIKDRETVDIRKEFAHTVAFIQSASKIPNARVLIHCVQGVSRSSTIVIWYLMLETKCTLSAAYSYVLKRRPLIFPNRGFMEQLMENEKELYGEESVLPQELDLLQHGLLPPLDRKGSELRRSLS